MLGLSDENKVIVLYLDKSGSMEDHLELLKTEVTKIAERFYR